MWPTLIEVQTAVGPMPVNTYGLFMILAFSAAFLLIHLRAVRIGVNPDQLVMGYVSAAVGGLTGGRVLYALAVEPSRTFSDPMSLLSCSGFAVYGGILGGILGVALFVRARGLPIWQLSDLAAPGVVLGMGIGRFGCFFSGCCHGAVAPIGADPIALLPGFTGGQLWLSNVAPFLTNEVHGGVGRLHDLPLYPTQLWAVVVLCSLSATLAWLWTRRRFDGQIAALTLMVEPPTRIAIEAFRADHRGYFVSWPVSDSFASLLPGMTEAGGQLGGAVVGLTTSQGIGLLMMAAGFAMWRVRRNAGVHAEAPIRAGEGDLLEDLA